MVNFDNVTNENKVEHNPNWPYILDHSYRIIIIGGSGSGETNALLDLINHQADIDKIYLYVKSPYEPKYQYLINKREKVDLKHCDDSEALLNTQMICKMFIKILKNTIQERNANY